jgi:hypothetical protein
VDKESSEKDLMNKIKNREDQVLSDFGTAFNQKSNEFHGKDAGAMGVMGVASIDRDCMSVHVKART